MKLIELHILQSFPVSRFGVLPEGSVDLLKEIAAALQNKPATAIEPIRQQ